MLRRLYSWTIKMSGMCNSFPTTRVSNEVEHSIPWPCEISWSWLFLHHKLPLKQVCTQDTWKFPWQKQMPPVFAGTFNHYHVIIMMKDKLKIIFLKANHSYRKKNSPLYLSITPAVNYKSVYFWQKLPQLFFCAWRWLLYLARQPKGPWRFPSL